ncbi:MAG: hypothetical protein HQ541_01135, partial [Mariniphaga sp.]|nr:hypothetical protein [Mariniphaga sp.]
GLATSLNGKILLQVEENGEAWYVYPNDLQRYFLGRPADAFNVMRNLGLGISEKNFNNFNGVANDSLRGKILLRVEAHGEAYYVNTYDLRLYYLGRPSDAFGVMRSLGLGITNADLAQIQKSPASASSTIQTIIPQINNDKPSADPIINETVSTNNYQLNYSPQIQNYSAEGITITACLVKWNETIVLPSIAYLDDYFSNVNNDYNEISLGKSYIKKVNIIYPEINYNLELPANFPDEENLVKELCDPIVDFSNTDLFVVFPSAVVGRGGASSSSMIPLFTNEKQINARILLGHYDHTNGYINHLTLDKYGIHLLIHEMSHTELNNSLTHDAALECADQSFSKNNCTSIEYGNQFSSMSNNVGHYSAWYKYLAGPWITKQNVTNSGVYTLASIESVSSKNQLLRLPNTEQPLCIEYRLPTGLDEEFSTSNITAAGYSGGIPVNGCLLISLCTDSSSNFTVNTKYGSSETSKNKNYLLDTTPNSQPASQMHDFYDACLPENSIFSNEELGVTISFTKNNYGVDADVNIVFDSPGLNL